MGLPEMTKNGLAGNAKYRLAGNENVPWDTLNKKACSDRCIRSYTCTYIGICIFNHIFSCRKCQNGLAGNGQKNGLAGNAKYGLAGNENVPWYTPNAKACSDKCLCNCICVCIFICKRNSPAAAKNKGKEPKRTKKTRKRKRMGKEQSHPTRTFPSLLHSPTSAFSDAYIFLSTSLTRGQHHIPVEPLTDCCALIRDAVLEYLSLSLLSLT